MVIYFGRGGMPWCGLFLEALHEVAVLLVVGVELKVFVEVSLCLGHVFLVEVVVAEVVVHHLSVGSIASACFLVYI